MKIALVQQEAGPDKAANLERGLAALDRAAGAGAGLVCFAELAFERFWPQEPAGEGFAELAEPVPGPTTEAIAQRAKRHGVVVEDALRNLPMNLFEDPFNDELSDILEPLNPTEAMEIIKSQKGRGSRAGRGRSNMEPLDTEEMSRLRNLPRKSPFSTGSMCDSPVR